MMKTINNQDCDFSDISALTWSAKEMTKGFHNCFFKFVCRSINKVAHAMALKGFRHGGEAFWVEEAPKTVVTAATENRRLLDPALDLWVFV